MKRTEKIWGERGIKRDMACEGRGSFLLYNIVYNICFSCITSAAVCSCAKHWNHFYLRTISVTADIEGGVDKLLLAHL